MKLILSGTPMTGFTVLVDDDWLNEQTEEAVCQFFRQKMVDLCQTHNLINLHHIATVCPLQMSDRSEKDVINIYSILSSK